MAAMEDHSQLTFGKYLQGFRNRQGISLETVSRATNISMEYLIAVEAENHTRLPAQVFVKGFLRAYAETIGADGDRAVASYLQSVARLSAAETGRQRRFSMGFFGRLCFSLLLLAGLVVTTILFESAYFSGQREETHIQPAKEKEPSLGAKTSEATKAQLVPQAQTAQTLILDVEATETVGLKIIIDGEKPKIYALEPGEIIKVEALRDFNILVDNPMGVRIFLNGNSVAVPRTPGREVNISLP